MMDLGDGLNRVCREFGTVDDNIDPILEDVEFYQILLTSDDNAVVAENRSVANIFIEDNDGQFFVLLVLNSNTLSVGIITIEETQCQYQKFLQFMY